MNRTIMAFGAHPDDVEIGIFGTLAKHVLMGDKVIIVDLTRGEMGSNGTVEIRKDEAQKAAHLIGATRVNLELPDRGLNLSHEQVSKIVETIRFYKADAMLYPYFKDYHPDHEMASRLIKEAWHFSGLPKYMTQSAPHRPKKMAMYYINDIENPNYYIDISAVHETKYKALEQHESQFMNQKGSRQTYLNDGFIEKIRIRDRYHGNLTGCDYAECIHLLRPPLGDNLWELSL